VTLTRSVVPPLAVAYEHVLAGVRVPGHEFVEALRKATKRPSAESQGASECPFPCTPEESTLTSSVVPLWTSRTNASRAPFESPATRFEAWLMNATKRASAEIVPQEL
jgi:hypothetical protein